MADIRYFNAADRLHLVHTVYTPEYVARGGVVPNRAAYAGGGMYFIGNTAKDGTGAWVPVTRAIEYKRNPSRHECDDRCMSGHINGRCECRCGGRNHGLNAT
jgi:hypothetical protein